jgi:hypothetical protein
VSVERQRVSRLVLGYPAASINVLLTLGRAGRTADETLTDPNYLVTIWIVYPDPRLTNGVSPQAGVSGTIRRAVATRRRWRRTASPRYAWVCRLSGVWPASAIS